MQRLSATQLKTVLHSTMKSMRSDIEYTSDPAWHDIWKTPQESILEGGDCEDQVIYMYFTLLLKGVSDRDMAFVAGSLKRGRYAGVSHMVLQVSGKDKSYILDPNNRSPSAAARYMSKNMTLSYSMDFTGVRMNNKLMWDRKDDPRWRRLQTQLRNERLRDEQS